jgi:hypothetical protein
MGDMSDRVKLAREIAARTEPRFIDTTRDASTDHRAPAEANAHHFAARMPKQPKNNDAAAPNTKGYEPNLPL